MDQGKIFRAVKIFLVEDSPSDVRLMREALRDTPMNVQMTVARDGSEALEYLAGCKTGSAPMPDIILLDLNLPKKNGHDVLKEVKTDPQLKQIPVLVLTSSGDETDIAVAYSLNANCYIRKPSDLSEYERVVQAIEDFWLMTVTLPDPSSAHGDPSAFAANSAA